VGTHRGAVVPLWRPGILELVCGVVLIVERIKLNGHSVLRSFRLNLRTPNPSLRERGQNPELRIDPAVNLHYDSPVRARRPALRQAPLKHRRVLCGLTVQQDSDGHRDHVGQGSRGVKPTVVIVARDEVRGTPDEEGPHPKKAQ
jgi:hypothetical protein